MTSKPEENKGPEEGQDNGGAADKPAKDPVRKWTFIVLAV